MIGAIYGRISIDDEGEGKGVARQVRICRGLARERGIELPDEFVFDQDSDITGSGEKRRPDYERLIETIKAGRIGAVVTTEVERLQRGLREYLEFFEAAEAQRLLVVWDGGSANFATGEGIDALEDRATDARKELRKIRRRVRRKHEELLAAGKYTGQHRVFGYRWEGPARMADGGRLAVVEDEAELIREAADRVVGGEALNAICRDWNRRGARTVEGNEWVQRSLKRMLVSGRISGRRDYGIREDGRRLAIPRIVADGDWPAIITPEASDRVRALLEPNSRPASARRHLLTGGLARCGLCGAALQPQGSAKVQGGIALYCRSTDGYGGCGRISLASKHLEAFVRGAFFDAVEQGRLAEAVHARRQGQDETAQLYAALEDVKARLERYAQQMDAGDLDEVEWQVLRRRQLDRRAQLERRITEGHRQHGLDWLAAQVAATDIRVRWGAWSLHERRAAVKLLIDRIVVHSAGRRGVWDPSRIEIRWRV